MTNNRVCTECKGSDEVRLAKAGGTSDGVECSKRNTKGSDGAMK